MSHAGAPAANAASVLDARAIAIDSVRVMANGGYADLVRLVHPHGVNREAKAEPPAAATAGPDGFWATAHWLRTAFSELDFKIHDVAVEGDLAVVYATMSGRHTGPMVTYASGEVESVMPPTGKRFATTQTHWLRLQDGQVVEHWANRDDIGMARQLGWVPPTPLFLLRQAVAVRRARRAQRRPRASTAA
jgi:predicted ester cyclase